MGDIGEFRDIAEWNGKENGQLTKGNCGSVELYRESYQTFLVGISSNRPQHDNGNHLGGYTTTFAALQRTFSSIPKEASRSLPKLRSPCVHNVDP